jgi:hypothetical protein
MTSFTLYDDESGKWSRVEFMPGDVLVGVDRVGNGWRYTVLRVCGRREEG